MQIVRRKEELVIGTKDLLYGFIVMGIILILLNIYSIIRGYELWFSAIAGIVVIIFSLLIPTKSIILNYKNKELYLIKNSIVPVFNKKKVFPVQNIKKIYAELNLKETFSLFRSRVMLLDKKDQAIILYRFNSGSDDGFVFYYRYTEHIANILNEKVQDLNNQKK